jgi:hypothetical protein
MVRGCPHLSRSNLEVVVHRQRGMVAEPLLLEHGRVPRRSSQAWRGQVVVSAAENLQILATCLADKLHPVASLGHQSLAIPNDDIPGKCHVFPLVLAGKPLIFNCSPYKIAFVFL